MGWGGSGKEKKNIPHPWENPPGMTVELSAVEQRRYAEGLHQDGVVVIPVFDGARLARLNNDVFAAIDEFPEYKVTGRDKQRVLGGFGAYGNPSSFHHITIRRLRKMIHHHMMGIFQQYGRLMSREGMSQAKITEMRYEMLLDRLCVRAKAFGKPTAEAWHRDVYDHANYGLRELPIFNEATNEMDPMFGGWINLNPPGGHTQHFVGIVGSHNTPAAYAAQREGGGFAALTKEAIRAQDVNGQLKAQANQRTRTFRTDANGKIIVPPGHAVIFFQRVLHSVQSGPQPDEPSLRLFLGQRLTFERVPLFQELDEWITNGAVPRIPSGQRPPMFSGQHFIFFNKPDGTWRTWGDRVFKRAVLFKRFMTHDKSVAYYTPGSPDNKNEAANRGRYMDSLRAYGLWDADLFTYSAVDRRVLRPERLFPRSSSSSSSTHTRSSPHPPMMLAHPVAHPHPLMLPHPPLVPHLPHLAALPLFPFPPVIAPHTASSPVAETTAAAAETTAAAAETTTPAAPPPPVVDLTGDSPDAEVVDLTGGLWGRRPAW